MPYQWTAQLKDQTYIPQFEGKTEANFKKVLDAENAGNLSMLHVSSDRNNYAVDLINGMFYIDNVAIDLIAEWRISKFIPENPNFRVIFYRRNRRISGGEIEEQFLYAVLLGWQITIDGVNHQRIMFIKTRENGNAMVEFREKR